MLQCRTSSATELLVEIRRNRPEALHSQLEIELRTAIRAGRLRPDAVLPSTRALADQLEISRGVVVEAYAQLVAEGYLVTRPGGSTSVSAARPEPVPFPSTEPAEPGHEIDFGPSRPDVDEFPRQLWLRSLRRVLNEAPSDRLTYGDLRGRLELRDSLAAYLGRVRRTAASPERIVICSGFAQALRLVTEVLQAQGAKRIALEDPGQLDASLAAGRVGLEVVPIPVDESGMSIEALERTTANAVVVTPAHHFPTGSVLSAERRTRLLSWATERNGFIVEDDYDAEYRYDREPIGALQGLAPERVIYAGTASKTLAPGLRLGWLIAPSALVAPLAQAKEEADRGSPSIEQLAFADFLAHGEFDRHLRRMRLIYRRRRDLVIDALRRHAPDLAPAGASAGLHLVVWLPADVDEAMVVEGLAHAGVRVSGMARYRIRHAGPGGLLLGYATLSDREIETGIGHIGAVLRRLRRETSS